VQYFPQVPRRHNEPGVPGGLQGVTTSALLGTINTFYVFGIDDFETFVEISELPIKDRLGSMYIVDRIPLNEARLNGFDRAPSGATKIIHIDSIAYKIKLAPALKPIHSAIDREGDEGDEDESEDDGADTLCAIPMWEAR